MSGETLIEVFDVPNTSELGLEAWGLPRYNIAPTQEAPAMVLGPEGRRLGPLRWGLVPFWADDPSIGNRLINARSETAPEKPAFREAFRKRRCLIPADGFYEWQAPESGSGPKTPYWIHREEGDIFTLAGLWERWDSDGDSLTTFTILTTDAPDWMRPIHDRMPVLIGPEHRDAWMSRETGPDEAREIMETTESGTLEARPVSTYVNAPAHEGPECVRAVEP